MYPKQTIQYIQADHGLSVPTIVNESYISVFEKLAIKIMSDAYVGEFNRASAKNRQMPYTEVDEDNITERRQAVANKMKALFSSVRKKQELLRK